MRHATALISRSLADKFCVWGDCENLADHPNHPLCDPHYQRIGMMFIHEHIEVMRAVAGAPTINEMIEQLATVGGPERRLLREQEQALRRAERAAASVIYYARVGEFIKIGTTTDLPQRMRALYVEAGIHELLATEPGGFDVERRRHQQFAEERHHRELFEPSDRLMAHIDTLRE